MKKAVYIVGGIAVFLALLASVLAVLFALMLLDGAGVSDRRAGLLVIGIALLHFATPIVGILLARRSRPGLGLVFVCVSLLVSLGLLALLPGAIGAAGQ